MYSTWMCVHKWMQRVHVCILELDQYWVIGANTNTDITEYIDKHIIPQMSCMVKYDILQQWFSKWGPGTLGELQMVPRGPQQK